MALRHRVPAAIAAALFSLPACASYHTYVIDELYSNADGTVQYVVLHESLGMNGQNLLAGHTLTATHAGQKKTYSFVRDLPGEMCGYYNCMPSPTAGTRVLIGTDGFAALGLVTPDYVVPNGFLPIDGGTVDYAGVDALTFAALPTDGLNALYRDGTTRRNVATNFAQGRRDRRPVRRQLSRVVVGDGRHGIGMGDQFRASGRSGLRHLVHLRHRRARPGGCRCLPTDDATGNTYRGAIYVDSGPSFNNFVGAGSRTPGRRRARSRSRRRTTALRLHRQRRVVADQGDHALRSRHRRRSRSARTAPPRPTSPPRPTTRTSGGRRAAPSRAGASTSRIRATRCSRPGTPTMSTARRCGCRRC